MDDFFTTLAMLGPGMIYTILFLSAFVENIFPLFPSDVVILIGACLVGKGDIEFIPLAISIVSGGFLGFMGVYAIGRYRGRPFFTGGRCERRITLFVC